MPSRTLKDYIGYQNGGMAQPSSTGVHNNIDSLILQAELDKLAQTGSMRVDRTPEYIGGVDPVVENVALSPIMTLKSLGSVGRKILEKTGLRNPVSHFTTNQGATNILKTGNIKGFPEVSVTRDPMFTSRPHGSIGTDIRFILDRDELVKKGFPIKPIAVNNYKKTLNDYGRPPITLENYRKIHGYYPDQMNPRFEFEERVRGNIPTENIKLIDILNIPTPSLFGGESPIYNERLISFLRALSEANIPMIKSTQVEKAFKKIPKSELSELIQAKAPTYKYNPFKVSDYYSF